VANWQNEESPQVSRGHWTTWLFATNLLQR
jgi:hypothetical protein